MNRNRYRLIFDKRTGTLVPVAEFTTSAKKGNGGGIGAGVGETSSPRWNRLCAATAMACWGAGVPLALSAQQVVDPSNGATLGHTANGVPLINIVDPNAAGLSHNKFLEFNVSDPGAVFNNSLVDGTTAVGGAAMKNPHLTRNANGILVEVTGRDISRLEGALEVFGPQADLLIANPNGLFVNGVSAINVGSLSLTTGRPDATGRAFEIHGGHAEIGARGINLEHLTHFDVVARSIALHGEIGGADIPTRLAAGLNTFDTTTGEVRKREDGGGAGAPGLGISGSSVGAMHGSHVRLLSTESGVGVRHEGTLTSVGDIRISSAGDLRLRHSTSVGDLAMDAAGGASLGDHDASPAHGSLVGGTLDLRAGGDAEIRGHHEVAAAKLHAGGTLQSDATLVAFRRSADAHAGIELKAQAIEIEGGHLHASDGLAATAGGDLRIASDAILSGQSLDLAAGRLLQEGLLSAAQHLRLRLGAGDSHNAGTITSESGALTIEGLQASLRNAGAVHAASLLLDVGHLDNVGALTGSVLRLHARHRLDNAGLIAADTLDIVTDWLRNAGASAVLHAASGTRLRVAHDVENRGGAYIGSGAALAIEAGGALVNSEGAALQGADVSLATAGRLQNDAVIVGVDGVTLHADTLDNSGTLDGGRVDVRTRHDLVNRDGGTLFASRDLTAQVGGALINRDGGRIIANDTLKASIGGALTNRGARAVIAADRIALTAEHADNSDAALLQGNTTLTLLLTRHLANSAWLVAGDTLHVTADGLDNTGSVSAYDIDAAISGDLTNRDGGRLQASGTLDATVGGALVNRGAGSALLGAVISANVSGALDNHDGALVQASYALMLEASRLANRNARLMAGATDATSGAVLVGDMSLAVTAGDIVNDAGAHIIATGNAWIDAKGNVHNGTNAKLAADQVILSATGDVANAATASIDGVTGVDLRMDGTLDNDGRIAATGVWLEAGRAIDNAGQLVGGSWLHADTLALVNASTGTIEAKHDVNLQTDTFAHAGRIHSDHVASLTLRDGKDLVIGHALAGITANEALILNAGNVRIERALSNAGSIVIHASGGVDNLQGIITGKDLSITATGAFTNRMLAWAGGDIDLRAASLRNHAGAELEATRHLWIEAEGALVNEAGARIAAGGHAAIDAQVLHNEVRTTGGHVVVDQERGHGTSYHGHSGRTDKYELFLGTRWSGGLQQQGAGLAVLGSTLTVTDAGVIEAGGHVRLNQGAQHGRKAEIVNGGLIQAGGDLWVDGDLHNRGFESEESIADYLRRPLHAEIKASALAQRRSKTFANFHDLLDGVFDRYWEEGMGLAGVRWYATEVAKSFKTYDQPQFNALMSHIFQADWRSASYDTLVGRWHAFKADIANRSGLTVLADRGAELAAGGSLFHSGGQFHNGGQRQENRTITVAIGDEQVETIGGHFDVLTNLGDLTQSLDPRKALDTLTREGNSKFRPSPSGTDLPPMDWLQQSSPTGPIAIDTPLPPVQPLYETRIEFIDQSLFHGTDYFFRQIGFVPDRTVTVIGDNYFINELITRQISGQVGSFLAVRDQVSGADLVQHLMDGAGEEGARLGLRVGVAPSAEQLANLDRDIVWMVEQDVDGQKALVPTVYLAKQTLADVQAERASGGASVAAGAHVVIDADEGGVRNHDGNIRAGKTLAITSKGGVDNSAGNGGGGGMRAGDALIIEATGDVTNTGSAIEGRDVAISTDGNFVDSVRMGYNDKGDLVVRRQGGIRGGGDGSVSIEAKGDVTLTASDIRAKHVAIEAGGDLVAKDVHEVKSSYRSDHRRNLLGSVTVTETKANATSVGSTLRGAADGGTLVLKAGKDITLQGGDYGADQGLIKAGRDVITKTGRDYSHSKTVTVSEGLTLGARAGALGAGAAVEIGPEGVWANTAVDGVENPKANGGRPNPSGKAVLGESLGAEFGYKRVELTETRDTLTNRNAQLDFGSGIDIVAEGTVDIGGVDIRAAKGERKGDIAIQGGKVISTKHEDVDRKTSVRKETFIGITASGSSSVLDMANKTKTLADKTKDKVLEDGTVEKGMTVDAAGTAAQVAGDVTNLVFNDLASASLNASIKHSTEKSSETTRSENINTLSGNISIKSTKGDIDLAGVVLDGAGASVSLDSANKIRLGSAKSHMARESSTESHQISAGFSASVAPTGAGLGYSMGYNGDMSETRASGTTHTNTQIIGGNVSIKSKSDTTLVGAEVSGGKVGLDVGGKLRIESVQDTYDEHTTKANWGVSLGGAVTTQSPAFLLAPTGGVNAGGGESWDRSAKTGSQSGIKSGELDVKVGGDLEMKGGHLIAEQGGSVAVKGRISSERLKDTHDKDGYMAGGGGGIGKSGLVSVDIVAERDDRIAYESTQLNTIAGVKVSAGKGTSGAINTDANKTEEVHRDEKVAGNQVSMTMSIDDIQEGVANLRQPGAKRAKKTKGRNEAFDAPEIAAPTSPKRALGSATDVAARADKPSRPDVGVPPDERPFAARSNSSRDTLATIVRDRDAEPGVPAPDYPTDPMTPAPDYPIEPTIPAPDYPIEPTIPAPDYPVDGLAVPAPDYDTKYDSRLILELEHDSAISTGGPRLHAKHSNSVLMRRGPNGDPVVLKGKQEALSGRTKVEVLGHGDRAAGKLAGLTPAQVTDAIAGLRDRYPIDIAKVSVVGCRTADCMGGPSYAEKLKGELASNGIRVPITGYKGPIYVDREGHKASWPSARPSDSVAYGKEDGLGPPDPAANKPVPPLPSKPLPPLPTKPLPPAQPGERPATGQIDDARVALDQATRAKDAAQATWREKDDALEQAIDQLMSELGVDDFTDEVAAHPTIVRLDAEARLARDALSEAVDSVKKLDRVLHPPSTRELLGEIPYLSNREEFLQQLQDVPLKNAEFYDGIPDGRITAKIMSDYGVDEGYIAVRVQEDRYTDFETHTIQGHQNVVAKVLDGYDPVDGRPRQQRGATMAQRTDRDALNVMLVPDGRLGDVMRAGYYDGTDKSWVSFPLLDALKMGARLYPDLSSSVRPDGGAPFLVTLPKGSRMPVEIVPKAGAISEGPGTAANGASAVADEEAQERAAAGYGSERGGMSDTRGKQGYMLVPMLEVDTPAIVFGEALRRADKGQAPYPVILRNARDAAAYQDAVARYRDEAIADVAALDRHGPDLLDALSAEERATIDYARKLAAFDAHIPVFDQAQTGILGTLSPEDTKLHIVGHGSAGADHLLFKVASDTNVTVDLDRIATRLRQDGLSRDYRDIRLNACFSSCAGDDGGLSMGAQLRDALQGEGFEDIVVSGYPGSVLRHPKVLEDGRLHAVVELQEGDDYVRRSETRERFGPESDGVSGGAYVAGKKQGYMLVPRVDEQTPDMILGEAMRRVEKGKEPYPVILPNAGEVAALNDAFFLLQERASQNLAAVESMGEEFLDALPEDERSAIENTRNIASFDKEIPVFDQAQTGILGTLSPEDTKLYITGHGLVGSDNLLFGIDGGIVTIGLDEMARQLKEDGLPSGYRDVRLLACYASCSPEDGGPSMGAQLRDAMEKEGFTDAVISAYPGIVRNYPLTLADGGAHAMVELYENNALVRRSEHRERFGIKEDAGAAVAAAGNSAGNYDARVIVDLGPATDQAAHHLFNKHPDSSVVIRRDAQGAPQVVEGDADRMHGKAKVELVGHGEGEQGARTLGGRDADALAREVADLQNGAVLPPIDVIKVTAVGCETGLCAEGSGLANRLGHALARSDIHAPVSGYAGRIEVDAGGRKQPVAEGGLDLALTPELQLLGDNEQMPVLMPPEVMTDDAIEGVMLDIDVDANAPPNLLDAMPDLPLAAPLDPSVDGMAIPYSMGMEAMGAIHATTDLRLAQLTRAEYLALHYFTNGGDGELNDMLSGADYEDADALQARADAMTRGLEKLAAFDPPAGISKSLSYVRTEDAFAELPEASKGFVYGGFLLASSGDNPTRYTGNEYPFAQHVVFGASGVGIRNLNPGNKAEDVVFPVNTEFDVLVGGRDPGGRYRAVLEESGKGDLAPPLDGGRLLEGLVDTPRPRKDKDAKRRYSDADIAPIGRPVSIFDTRPDLPLAGPATGIAELDFLSAVAARARDAIATTTDLRLAQLTPAEYMALFSFLDGGADELNDMLSGVEYEEQDTLQARAEAISRGLDTLAAFDPPTGIRKSYSYVLDPNLDRGLRLSDRAAGVRYRGFLVASANDNPNRYEGWEYDGALHVVFGTSGVDVRGLNRHNQDEDVIFPANTEFDVLVGGMVDGHYRAALEEHGAARGVPPPLDNARFVDGLLTDQPVRRIPPKRRDSDVGQPTQAFDAWDAAHPMPGVVAPRTENPRVFRKSLSVDAAPDLSGADQPVQAQYTDPRLLALRKSSMWRKKSDPTPPGILERRGSDEEPLVPPAGRGRAGSLDSQHPLSQGRRASEFRRGSEDGPHWKHEVARYKATIAQVEGSYVTPTHRVAIEQAARKGKFAVSFRAAGPATLAALEKGAAAKGHDILEKTIKPSSIAAAYPSSSQELLQRVRDAGLEGYVGHWSTDTGELKGMYMSSQHGLGDLVHGRIFPLDIDHLDDAVASLEHASGGNWQRLPFTGDYDMHDMLTFRGAGVPHTPLVDSREERDIIDALNHAVAKADPMRPFHDVEHNVIRHGPQVNFSSYMLAKEAGDVRGRGGFLGVVARPGEFPVAMVNQGAWSIIPDNAHLADFYKSVGAHIKETWNPEGVRTYVDAVTGKGLVNLGRRGSAP